MSRQIAFLFFFFFVISYCDVVQRSSSQAGIIIESISQVTLDRPWLNMTSGLICESSQKTYCDLWSYSPSRMLKVSNFSFYFPEQENPIIIRGVFASWTVSITRKPYQGVRESKVSLFLPNRTSPINTKIKIYPNVVGEDGWQTTETVISYPLINESSIWGITEGISAEQLTSPSFGVGLTIQNGASDTRAMVGCVLISVIYDILVPTTTTTTPEPTSTFVDTMTSTIAKFFNLTTATPKTTKKTRTTSKAKTTTAAKKIIDETTGSGQTIIALIILSALICLLLIGCVLFLTKQHKKWRVKLSNLKKSNNSYQQINEISLREMKNMRKNNFLKEVDISNDKLGAGTTGVVYLGSMDNGSTKVACKMYYPTYQDYIREEMSEIFTLKHVNIVQLMGLFEDVKLKLVVIMEYFPRGSLRDFFATADMKSWYSENQELNNRSISLAIAKGMLYLKNKDIIHGNLSPKNVMVELRDEAITAKISDFWMGKYLPTTKNNTLSKRVSALRPTSEYPIAPELTQYADEQYSTHSDIYSFGYLLHFIYVLGNVKEKKSEMELAMSEKPHAMQENIFQFQQRCHNKIPHERPEFSDAVNFFHPLYEEQLNMMFTSDDEYSTNDPLISDLKKKQESSSLFNNKNNVHYARFDDV